MLDFDALFAALFLRVLVTTNTGLPIAGASVFVYDQNGGDVTQAFTGLDYPKTDDNGLYLRSQDAANLVKGVYQFVIKASGYTIGKFSTEPDFKGTGLFKVSLEKSKIIREDVTIIPPPIFVSAMKPIVYEISFLGDIDIKYLKVKVQMGSGHKSTIKVPLYGRKKVTVDVSNRIRLGVTPLFVPPNVTSITDSIFSDTFQVSFLVDTEAGEMTLGDSEIDNVYYGHVAANFFIEGANDMSQYVYGVRKWITPSPSLSFDVGFYADVMLWLPVLNTNEHFLKCTYLDSMYTEIETDTRPVPMSDYVQRFAVNPNPPFGTGFVEMEIVNSLGEIVSETLRLTYNYEDTTV